MVNVFIQVNKQFYYNALNDHNVKYSTKGWSPLTSSVILRISRSGLDSTVSRGQRFCGFRSQSLNPKGYLCLLLWKRNQDDNSGQWWYLEGAVNQPNHILGLNQQNCRNLKVNIKQLITLWNQAKPNAQSTLGPQDTGSTWERKSPEKAETGSFKWLL